MTNSVTTHARLQCLKPRIIVDPLMKYPPPADETMDITALLRDKRVGENDTDWYFGTRPW
jgi:hypothetical protein